MSLYEQSIPVFTQMLASLAGQLDKAKDHAENSGGSADKLMQARLAEDMHPLFKQVIFVCDLAGQTVMRLTGKKLEGAMETGETFADAKALIARTTEFLDEVSPQEMDSDMDRMIGFDLPNGMAFDMTAAQYMRDWALPQFYFHQIAAYMILRNKGVDLGKADYVNYMFKYMRK